MGKHLGAVGFQNEAYNHGCTNSDLHASLVAHSSTTHVGLEPVPTERVHCGKNLGGLEPRTARISANPGVFIW